jgi:hypothetical protein
MPDGVPLRAAGGLAARVIAGSRVPGILRIGIKLKAGQPPHITRWAGQFFFHDACRLLLRRKLRPSVDQPLPRNFLHAEAIGHGCLMAGRPDIELGNVVGNRDDQL